MFSAVCPSVRPSIYAVVRVWRSKCLPVYAGQFRRHGSFGAKRIRRTRPGCYGPFLWSRTVATAVSPIYLADGIGQRIHKAAANKSKTSISPSALPVCYGLLRVICLRICLPMPQSVRAYTNPSLSDCVSVLACVVCCLILTHHSPICIDYAKEKE